MNMRRFEIRTCTADAARDLALCRTKTNPFADRVVKSKIRPVTFATSEPADGSMLGFIGFPLDSARPVTARAALAVRYAQEQIIDKSPWLGNSGGPLFTPDGKVIGVVQARGEHDQAGLGYASTLDSLIDFLRENQVKFKQ